MTRGTTPTAIDVTSAMLRRWPLPQPDRSGDKEDRGRLLIVAGSKEVPGAAVLAANAALRSGVGKVTVITRSPEAVCYAVPEARVIEFPRKTADLARVVGRIEFDALLIGPGLEPSAAMSLALAGALRAARRKKVVIDAGALTKSVARQLQVRLATQAVECILTPHAGEMASLIGRPKARIEADARKVAVAMAERLRAVVVLKGSTTWIGASGKLWKHVGANPGLATSGSGDVLAGIVGALAARGAEADQAAVWGVALHALAGERLAKRYGVVGALAREIPAEIPLLMHGLSEFSRARGS